jgi:ribosomal-protein-alanine N-acetyltransferase
MGRAGLQNTHVGGNDEVELAYALVAEYWNRGLAMEMSRRSWSWLSSVSAWRT